MGYKFSIIVPIYNSEKYLKECIESIVNQQEINFEEDVQLILINDGSSDSSELIINDYIKMYNQNIKYVKQDNKGVSAARNMGLKFVRGKYVNFLDSDDMLSSDTLSSVEKFFLDYDNDIDVVSIPIYFFEGKNKAHLLNYKFNKDDIVDIEKNYDFIQMSISGTFIKADIITQKKFKESLKYGEDSYLITSIILEKKKYGLVKQAKYLYRYRETMDSTMQESWRKKEWFLDSMDKFTFDLINNGKKEYISLPKYLQYIILYDLSWKVGICRRAKNTLTYKEWIMYFNNLNIALKSIQLSVILKYRRINVKCMVMLLMIKYCNIDTIRDKYIRLIFM